ncbi:MAG: ABC transporter ATP-binding protein [Verrucomicrobia bacterium]|nr:ABC transporter ATP-binding protein [Verrucomicrobiota bacterium]
MADAILEIQGLTKRFGRRVAVDGLNLRVERGGVFGFLGPNGAGKTTTIRMVTGLIRPHGGEVIVGGVRLRGHRRRALRKIGALVETPAFHAHLSARTNLALFASLSRRVSGEELDEALDTVGLLARAGDKVKTYSHGMKQRLGIACALVPRPELLVLDEPSDGLDPHGIKEVRDLIRSLVQDLSVTVFVSSHILSEVEQMCGRVAIIDHGRLVTQGTIDELRSTEPAVVFRVDRMADARALLETTLGLIVLSSNETELRLALPHERIADVNAALVGAGVRVYAIVPHRQSLEDLFVQLTEKSIR